MSDRDTLLNLSRSLLDSIVEGNWQAYAELCDESLTCFEPEVRGHVVEGLAFHQFYFDGSPYPQAYQYDDGLAACATHGRLGDCLLHAFNPSHR